MSFWRATRLVAQRELRMQLQGKGLWITFGVFIVGLFLAAILPGVLGGDSTSTVATFGSQATRVVEAADDLEARAVTDLAQAEALAAELSRRTPGVETRVFISMRYWNPRADETARQVAAFGPDEVVLLPLYPQFSTTTTGSSVKDWLGAYKGPGRPRLVCCYPDAEGFVAAYANGIRQTWESAGRPANGRLLFSAHGLPQKVIDGGDPYEAQVRATAEAVAARLPEFADWRVSFQSRVGRLKWLEPSTEDEVRTAAADGTGLLICPIAFVSEHVETLVELDHEYAELARELGIATYLRSPTPRTDEHFIAALAEAVEAGGSGVRPYGPWLCAAEHGKCACRSGGILEGAA